MKRWTQIALMGVVVLALVPWAAAQGTLQVPTGTPQPTMRLGNFIEVGNDIHMHSIASSEFVYNTQETFDVERKVRERVVSRADTDTAPNRGGSDTLWMQARFGVDFRYQKSTELQLVLQQVTTLDGNTTDDRMNSTNPGGTDVF